MIGFEHIDAGEDRPVAILPAPRARERLIVAGDLRDQLVVICPYAQRSRYGCGYCRANRSDVGRPVGMNGVGHYHDARIVRWINPDRCAGEAGVTDRTHGKKFTAVARVWGIDVPSEGAK